MNRQIPVPVLAVFYEKRVRTFAELKKEVRRLDSDAGIRVSGSYRRQPCFAFVTRFVGSYTVMVYERGHGKEPAVGKRLFARDFGSPEKLDGFLQTISPRKVRASVY